MILRDGEIIENYETDVPFESGLFFYIGSKPIHVVASLDEITKTIFMKTSKQGDKMKTTEINCPICNGKKEQGKVTFTVDLGTNLIVIRDTPVTVCSLCGEEWISDEVAENIEAVESEAKMKNCMIEVVHFSLERVA